MIEKTSGFTLIEVLIAAGLTAVVIIGCVYLIASSGRQVSSLQELDQIASLHNSYQACISQDVAIRTYLSSSGSYNVSFDIDGCKIVPHSPGNEVGNKITYEQTSESTSTEYKKEIYYGTFEVFSGSID